MGARRHKPLSRSQQMARIRGRDTRPEILLRRVLWGDGCRYRLHRVTPGGRADFVFVSKKLAG